MKTVIVIPARGGSKGIPHKNIALLHNKPLLSYTIEVAINANLSETMIVVSTDDENIEAVARRYEQVRVIKRPDEISGDTASTEAALLHVLRVIEDEKRISFDNIITLQPTSPFRKTETLTKFIKSFEKNIQTFDAMITLHENFSDHWVKSKKGFSRLFPNAPRRRQGREPLYIENSSIYMTTVKALRETGSVLGTKVTGYIIDEIEGIDINEPIDMLIANAIMKVE